MSKEKQIEEMIEAIKKCSCVYTDCEQECSQCSNEELYDEALNHIARTFYEAGYRKQSDIIPCKIGDEVYAVKPYRNCKRIYKGKVTQMYFVGEEMKLAIVVNTVVRGEWGKAVFATEEEAKRSIEGDSDAE